MPSRHDLLFGLFSGGWLSPLDSATRLDCLQFYYHWIGNAARPHLRHLYRCKTLEAFDQDIEYLLTKYVPVSVLDVIEHVKRGQPLPKNAFMLTFDDGYR